MTPSLLLLVALSGAVDTVRVKPLVLLVVATTIYDVETTFRGIATGCCKEANPLARPFMTRRRDAYLYNAFGIAVITAISTSYLRPRTRWWWTPLALLALGHSVAGTLNLRF